MDLGIDGKIALVTGAASGIGLATAKMLLNEGTTVIFTDKDNEQLNQVSNEVNKTEKAFFYSADITSQDDLKELHQKVSDNVGRIDILVQSAGIAGEQGLFHELDDETWVNTLKVDIMGPVRVIKEFLPDLRTGGWGRLVLLSSENGVQPYEDETPYNCSKAALLALSKGLSSTYAEEGLTVNSVSPAFIESAMTDELVEQEAEEINGTKDEAIQSFLNNKKPHLTLNRRGKAEEAAAVIVFLCSDQASFVNGSNYRVDAGSVATI